MKDQAIAIGRDKLQKVVDTTKKEVWAGPQALILPKEVPPFPLAYAILLAHPHFLFFA